MAPDTLREALLHLIGLLDQPAFLVEAGGQVELANEAALGLTGWTSEEAIGNRIDRVLGLHDAASEGLLRALQECVVEHPFWQEVLCTARGGSPRWVRVRGRRVTVPPDTRVLLLIGGAGTWEERYKDILAGSTVVFFETLRDGQLVYGADQLAGALGYERPPASLQELLPDEQRALFDEAWNRAVAGEQVRGYELRLAQARGGTQPFWVSLFPVTGMNGEIVGIRGTASDLGEQKSLAYALEASEERFSVLFRESSDPILILSMKGEILSANPSFERTTGIHSDELFCAEQGWHDFVEAEDMPALFETINRCAESGQDQRVELRVKTQGHGDVWFEETLSILHDEEGQAKGIMAVARDIQRRKLQEFELREKALDMQRRHQRAQALISRLKSFFTRISALPTDIDSFIHGVCEILYEMYEPLRVAVFVEEKGGRVYEQGAMLPPVLTNDLGHPVESAMSRQVVETGLPLYSNTLAQTEPYAQDAVTRELGIETYLGAPLRDSTGRIWGTLSLVDREARSFDSLDVELITVAALHVAARLRAEEQEIIKRELEEHLRQAQKMEAVGMLAGGIAHDFNNILSGILGFASFLLSKVEEGSDLYNNLSLIEQSAVRASDLTRQLLAFARRKHFAKQPVSMNQCIEEVMGILQRSISKNVVIRMELAKDLPPVLGDPGQLNQVIMNLCLNAADAMSEKGGTLRLKTAHRLLTAREKAVLVGAGPGEYVCIMVSDTGRGMTEEIQKHIFDPFFTTKADRGGSGLGLSIVYGIITNHGGDITVESAPEKGSVFRLYFPVHHGAIASEQKPASLQLRGTETVLVVDDEIIVRQMVTAVLKEYGYKVIAVASGAEAVDMLKELKGRIHLALLDMVMPGMDGEATFHALRQVEEGLPVLLTSGFADEQRSARLIEQGAKGMIHKPYKSEELASKIREVLTAHVWSGT